MTIHNVKRMAVKTAKNTITLFLVSPREKVERILYERKLSVAWLAREIGESRQTVFNWLNKPQSPSDPDAWRRVADALDVSVKQLLDPAEPLPEPFFVKEQRREYGLPLPAAENILEILIEILESPDEPPERKQIAKNALRDLLKGRTW